MPSRYSDETNKELYRVVKSFNQRVRRHEKKGEKNLPDLISVSRLKSSFRTERDMKKELSQYKHLLNNKQAFARYKAQEGSITNWEFDYIVKNLQSTEQHINREIIKEMKRLSTQKERKNVIRDRLRTLQHEREVVNRDLTKLTASELKVVSGTIDRFKHFNLRIQAGRKYFERNLDYLLGAKGVSLIDRQKIYAKLDTMTNEEFDEFYKKHDVVSEVMIKIPSLPSSADEKKTAQEAVQQKETKDMLDDFEKDLDENIKQVRKDVKKFNTDYKKDNTITTTTGKKLTQEEFFKLFDKTEF